MTEARSRAPRSPPLAAQPITIVTEPPGPRAREMIARALPHLSPSLIHCYPLMVRRASGCMVEDVDGNVYLDAEAGVATASTGHCHPAVADAIAAQARGADPHLRHRLSLPGLRRDLRAAGRAGAAHRAQRSHHWQTFLTNSGTEAVEAAIKLARHHTGRPRHHRVPRRLPRPHARVAVADREQVEVPAALRAAAARRATTPPTATPPASRSCSRR